MIMYLKFFLTFSDSIRGFSVGSNTKQKQTATDNRSNTQLPLNQRTSFGNLLGSLSSSMLIQSQYLNNNFHTREILVNLSDESMFQLETLYVSEYSYCTYNMMTNLIGFGNSIREAYDASCEIPYPGFVLSGSVSAVAPSYMLQFYIPESEPEKMKFTCPVGFYEQVLNELKPYISYEKRYLFKYCTDVIERETRFIENYLDSYFDKTIEPMKYNGTSLNPTEFKYTLKMFMEDDVDIFSHREEHQSGLRTLGALCLKMMQLTNETF